VFAEDQGQPLTNEEIGSRIREARKSAGLSEEAFAELLGLTQPTVSRIEAGKRSVGAAELVRIAEAVGRPAQAFLEATPQARYWFRLAEYVRPGPMKEAVDWAERFMHQVRVLREFTQQLELPANDRLDFEPPASVSAAQLAADNVRRQLGLGDGPAPDLYELIERTGCLVKVRQFDEWGPDAVYVPGPVSIIVLNGAKPGPRQRFTLAHEFAHFLFDRATVVLDEDVYQEPSDGDRQIAKRERIANAFAAHFLMPKSGIEAELVRRFDKRIPTEVTHAFWLAYHFGVSLQAICYQLESVGLAPAPKTRRWMHTDQHTLAGALGLLTDQQHQAVRERWPREFLVRLAVALERELITPTDAARHLQGDQDALNALLAHTHLPASEAINFASPA